MRLFENSNVNFIGKRKIAYVFSSTLLIVGILSLFLRGLELGIDFKGGTEIGLKFEKPIVISQIRQDLQAIGLGNVEVKTFGGEKGILIRTELQEVPRNIVPQFLSSVESAIDKHYPGLTRTIVDSSSNSIIYQLPNPDTTNSLINKLTTEGFNASVASLESDNTQMIISVGMADVLEDKLRETLADNPFTVEKEDLVGPKIGEELKTDALIAIILSLFVILIYLGFRFKFVFALGAVAALFHDVMITLGIFSMLYGIIPGLNLEISINVVAAFLSLIGYSINDTVVVFDRVRENLKIHKTAPLEENINKAINKTMRRTIVTSVTTLLVVSVLLFFGGDVLRGFAFTLFFGILIGTYSSVFVASPFVYEYSIKRKQKIQF